MSKLENIDMRKVTREEGADLLSESKVLKILDFSHMVLVHVEHPIHGPLILMNSAHGSNDGVIDLAA